MLKHSWKYSFMTIRNDIFLSLTLFYFLIKIFKNIIILLLVVCEVRKENILMLQTIEISFGFNAGVQ